MTGFSTQDWESINCISADNRLISKFLKPVDYFAVDGTHYRFQPFTDYASVPSAFWGPPFFLIPYGWWSLPAAAHDSAFQNTLLVVQTDGTTHLADLSESESNDLLDEMMAAIKPTPTAFESLQRREIMTGLCLGGWHAYKVDRS